MKAKVKIGLISGLILMLLLGLGYCMAHQETPDPTIPSTTTTAQGQPTAPDPSSVPADPTEPTPGPTDPTESNPGPTNPTEPTPGPTNPTEPTPGPTNPTEPTPGPTDPTEPTPGPTDPTEPTPGPTDPTEPTPGPTDPTESEKQVITAADVQLDGTLTYNGQQQTQKIKVTQGITYEVRGNTGTNAGNYTLTVIGTGNYTGEVELSWTIEAGSIWTPPIK